MTEFTCQYCNRTFKRERTLHSHACEKRRRWEARSDTNVVIGFETFKKFYKYTQHSSKTKTYKEFTNSSYYIAMVRFGSYCLNVNAINTPRYADWLIKNEKPLDKWATDKFYDEFVVYFNRIEPVGDALTRTIKYSIEWSKERDEPSYDLFRKGSQPRIFQAIKMGKISPWVIYQSNSGKQFLENYSPDTRDSIDLIWNQIDPDYWANKFESNKEDTEFAQSMLSLGGF